MIHGGKDCKIRGLEIQASTDPLKLTIPKNVATPFYNKSDFSQLYVTGLNDADQLIVGSQTQLNSFKKIENISGGVKQVEMSAKGTILLYDSGNVVIFGDLYPKGDDREIIGKGPVLRRNI